MNTSRLFQLVNDKIDSIIAAKRQHPRTNTAKESNSLLRYLILLAPFGLLGIITYILVLLQSPLSPFHKRPVEQIVNTRAEMDKILRQQESKAEQRKVLSERLESDAARDEYQDLINEISSLSHEVRLLNSGIASESIKQAGTNQNSTPQQEVVGQRRTPPTSSQSSPAGRQNALRAAESYIKSSGFSRNGLISQLTSDSEKFSTADATYAVDSLNLNWNEQAARSAASYLKSSGFSCNGLIDQLSSASEQFTLAQARYGAKAAGACN